MNCAEKVAVTSPVLLSINCLTCSDGQMLDASYDWSITLYNDDTKQFDLVPDSGTFFSESGKLGRMRILYDLWAWNPERLSD